MTKNEPITLIDCGGCDRRYLRENGADAAERADIKACPFCGELSKPHYETTLGEDRDNPPMKPSDSKQSEVRQIEGIVGANNDPIYGWFDYTVEIETGTPFEVVERVEQITGLKAVEFGSPVGDCTLIGFTESGERK